MTSLANSPCPPPGVPSKVAYPALYQQLSAAIEGFRASQPSGLLVAPVRPQLLPAHAPYCGLLCELPHVGFCDVLLDVSGAEVNEAYRCSTGFAFRVAWTRVGDTRLALNAMLSISPIDHFALSSPDAPWVDAKEVWADCRPPAKAEAAGVGAVLLAFAEAVRALFRADRIPPALTAHYGACPHCPGCHTFEGVAGQARSLRAIFAASAASLQVWPDASPDRIAAATRLLAFPVLPRLPPAARLLPAAGADEEPPVAADASTAGADAADAESRCISAVSGSGPVAAPASGAPPPPPDGSSVTAAVPPPGPPPASFGRADWDACCAPPLPHPSPVLASLPVWSGLLAPELVAALASDALPKLLREEIPGAAWSFPLLTPAACVAIMDTAEQHEAFARRRGIRVTRPNSMNRYGVILRACGLEPFVRSLTHAALAPIAEAAFPLEALPGGGFTNSHSFIVAYDAQEGKDRALDMHTDDSDVTFNVCLGKEFSGASLTFCGALGAADHRKRALTYMHEVGRCVVHRGLQRHGADAITAGHRRNLIIWLSNKTFSALPCGVARWEAETRGVDPVCASFTHDRDYEERVGGPPPPGAVRGAHPWCPHPDDATVRIK